MPIYGSGLNSREWIHVSDHVSALLTIIDSESKETIINIVGNIENYKKSSFIEFKKCAFKKEIIQIETEIKIEPKKK